MVQKTFFINALIQSLGDNGNNGGTNPFVIHTIGDGFFTVPIGTLVGQRMTLPSSPVRITRVEFVVRREGLTGSPTGTLVGKVRRNTIPLDRISIGSSDEIISSTNTINIADITNAQSGQTIAFDFDPVDPEVTETENMFIGFEVEGANDNVLISTNSDPNTILGGDIVIEEPCSSITSLRSDRLGGAIFHDNQFSNYNLRPLRDISSNLIPLGEKITHIRLRNGDGGTSKFRLAIYEGPAPNPVLKAQTPIVSFVGTGVAQEVDIPLISPYIIGTTIHANIWVGIAIDPNTDEFGDPQPPAGHNRVNPALSFWSNDNNFTRLRITYSVFDGTNIVTYPDFPSPTFNAPAGVFQDTDETPYFQLLGPNVNANFDTCWSPDQGEDAVLTITIDEELRQRGVASMNAILIQATKELEFSMRAKLVFRTAVNCTCPNALLQAQDQEEEFFTDAILTKVGVGGQLPVVNVLIKSIGGVSGSYIPTTFTIDAGLTIKGLTPIIVNAFIQAVNQVEFIIDVRLGIREKTFSLGAKVGLDEPQSILDVESVI